MASLRLRSAGYVSAPSLLQLLRQCHNLLRLTMDAFLRLSSNGPRFHLRLWVVNRGPLGKCGTLPFPVFLEKYGVFASLFVNSLVTIAPTCLLVFPHQFFCLCRLLIRCSRVFLLSDLKFMSPGSL